MDAKAAKEAAKVASETANRTRETVADALDAISKQTSAPTASESMAILERDAITLTRSDFTVGLVVALVGREPSGGPAGSEPSMESKRQELIHEATQVDTWNTSPKPVRKGRALTHHIWWGVVMADQKRDATHPKTVLLKWL
jgi:hypothetical protein